MTASARPSGSATQAVTQEVGVGEGIIGSGCASPLCVAPEGATLAPTIGPVLEGTGPGCAWSRSGGPRVLMEVSHVAMTVVEFLEARVAEDELTATAAVEGSPVWHAFYDYRDVKDGDGHYVVQADSLRPSVEQAAHIARQRPRAGAAPVHGRPGRHRRGAAP